MDARRFDRLTKGLARHLPRRGVLGGIGATGAAALALAAGRRAARAQSTNEEGDEEGRSVSIACTPCHCDGDGGNCQCCLNGITGGGIVRTDVGDATLVLFATELGDEAERQATGFVRWIDPVSDGGMTLESVGPITYEWQFENAQARQVRGTMSINGEGEEPFVLNVVDAGPEHPGSDTASIEVGNLAAAEGEGSGFGYAAAGQIIGGDIQLLETVAPVG